MKTEEIFNIRFLAPPGLAVFFIFPFSPLDFVRLIAEGKDISWIVGATGILGLGFLISSVTELFVKLLGLKKSECKDIYKRIKSLKGIFSNNNNKTDTLELASWMILDEADNTKSRQIPDQIHKRWNMAMANFNSVVAIIFALISVFLLCYGKIAVPPNCVWLTLYLLSTCIFLIIFWHNGNEACKSVRVMDCILANKVFTSESKKTQR